MLVKVIAIFLPGPEPISDLIVTVNKLFILEESSSITIILPRFSEENGRIG